MTCGIYMLSWVGTYKVYIGQSTDIEGRFSRHLNKMKYGNSSRKLNEAYKLYGLASIEILEVCKEAELSRLENYHIKLWDAVEDGFNTFDEAGSTGGMPLPGELNGNAKYSNEQVIRVFNYLVDNPYIDYLEAEKYTGVSVDVITKIATGKGHGWLKEYYPEKYGILMSIKGTRNRGENCKLSNTSNIKIIEVFDILIDRPNLTIPEISNITGVSKSIINHVCTCNRHTWLQDMYPERYKTLLAQKGTRKDSHLSAVVAQVVSPSRELYSISNITKFAKEHGLDPGALGKVVRGNIPRHKGWELYKDSNE